MTLPIEARSQNPQENKVWNERLLSNTAGITLRRLALMPSVTDFHRNDRGFTMETFDGPRKKLLDSLAETLVEKVEKDIRPSEASRSLPYIKQFIDADSKVNYYLKFAVIAGKGGLDTEAFFEPVHTTAAAYGENGSPQAVSVLRKVALARIQLGDAAPDAFKDVDAELDRQTTHPKDIYAAMELLLYGEDVILDKLDSGDNAGAITTYEMLLKKDEINGPGVLFVAETMKRIDEARKKLGKPS